MPVSIPRRLLWIALGLAAISLAGRAQGADAATTSPPNILFLLSDDHSYPYLGCYGYPGLRTPNLDRFAAEGMRFDRMFVSCPQCVPSRAALMTGRSPVAVRMVRFTSPLPPDVLTLPEVLHSEAGYFTGVAGRYYHLDGPAGKFASPDTMAVLDKYSLRTMKDRFDFCENSNKTNFVELTTKFLDAAAKEQGKPWFFWLNFFDPHHPWDAKASPQATRIDPAKLKLPPHLPDLPGVRQDLAEYLGEVERLDRDVQGVLDLLKERGFAQNTLVVFMGDNGMAFPRGKGTLYDPGLNVPLIVRWPGVVKAGSATNELVSGEDFAPTMIAAAGIQPPKVMSGQSYLELLQGKPHVGRKHVFAERGPHGGDGGMKPDIKAATFDLSRCVRSAGFKLIYNCTPHQPVAPVDSQRNPGWQQILQAHAEGTLAPEQERTLFTIPRPTFELYDLKADPGEFKNLSGDRNFADIERELKKALHEKMILDYDFLPLPIN